jgi:hypothetical protein
MSSKNDIITALDSVDAAYHRLLGLPLHTLTRSERVQLLQRLDALGKQLAAFDRQLVGRLITEAAPAQFGGATWPEVFVAAAADLPRRSRATGRRGCLPA